uniref:Ectonucleoside triphosphate diphosphohydrolase 8 n=1 Tax=Sinocyclocheilus grahami TaxID=75366 RepID=A0A672PVR1_SINGR
MVSASSRLLQNKSFADSILAEVTKTIQSYQFDFRGARILSGMEEGAYGWITINYLLESFIKGNWIHPKAGKILGALDLGDSAFNLQLYGYKYELYTHSYLCFGKDQALRKLQTAGSSPVISHPCYHVGYNLSLTLNDLYNSPCVVKPNNFNTTATVLFSGTGDSFLCLSLMENIVNLTDCAFSPDCGFSGQPPVNGEFFVSVSVLIKSSSLITSSIIFKLYVLMLGRK